MNGRVRDNGPLCAPGLIGTIQAKTSTAVSVVMDGAKRTLGQRRRRGEDPRGV